VLDQAFPLGTLLGLIQLVEQLLDLTVVGLQHAERICHRILLRIFGWV
jgi:hypothetical protein